MKRILVLSAAIIFFLPELWANNPLVIHLAGDSTMADKPLDKQNPERGWGQYFPSLFDDGVTVRNYAHNGRSTLNFRTLGHWQKLEENIRPGDWVFIQFGHNDGKKSDPERYAAPWDEYSENLRNYIDCVRKHEGIPVLLTPIARRHFDAEGNLKTEVQGDYPAAMRKVAEETGTLLIDMTDATNEWLRDLGDDASKPYFMNIAPGTNPRHPDGLDDNTHLNPKGASAVARMVARRVQEQLPELGAHVRYYDFVVAQDGSGDFLRVQDAVDAVPDYTKDGPVTLYIKNGTYRERVVVPHNKAELHIIGQSAENTIITYDVYASQISTTGHIVGTAGTATVYVHADDFTAENITFENSAVHPQGKGDVGQAVAFAGTGDRMRLRRCRFLGNQDTLYTMGPDSRQYYEECYIEGTTDFIFGFSTALFTNCEIHSKRNSYITAASTPREIGFGYVFLGCRLTAVEGITKVYLGRPWRPYAKTVFIGCEMGAHIRPEGWHNWSNTDNEKTAYYAEYGSTGPGAAPKERVKWSHQLSAKQAAAYTAAGVLGGDDGWNPLNGWEK